MRFNLLLIVVLVLLSFSWGIRSASRQKNNAGQGKPLIGPDSARIMMQKMAAEARDFAKQRHFNSATCFLVDMSLPSGQNRFYVYNLKDDSVIMAGLVTHGRCNEDWLQGRRYGNKPGCGCTSLGRYRIGYPYQGRFGLAFKLYGLDKTNDQAFARAVVLHSHDCVPESEIAGEICQSDGCPTVSPGFLKQLQAIIQSSPQPVLLWIYTGTK